MIDSIRHLVRAAGLVLALLGLPAEGGSLTRIEVEQLLDGQFIVGEVDAAMPVFPLFARDGGGSDGKPRLKGYAFETIDFKPVRGYSGKPINVLVAMDASGNFMELRLLQHREPFFTNPTGTARLSNFVSQYQDLSVRHSVRVLDYTGQTSRDDAAAELQGVKSGTVTAGSINRTILLSAADIAVAKLGLSESAVPRKRSTTEHYRRLDWDSLRSHGMVGTTVFTRKDIERQFAGTRAAGADARAPAQPEETALTLHSAVLTQPVVGHSLVDGDGWRYLNGNRRSAHVLLVTESGPLVDTDDEAIRAREPFAVELRQGGRPLPLRPLPYEKALAMPGYPERIRAHLFIVDKAAAFDPSQPFELAFRFSRKFGTNHVLSKLKQRMLPLNHDYHGWRVQAYAWLYTDWMALDWVKVWQSRAADIAVLVAGLALLTAMLVRLRQTSATDRRLSMLRTAYLLFTLGFVGWYAQGQLTIINVTAALESLSGGGDLGFMLNDPMSVILWAFTGVTLLFWGRSTFCGWLCPFGALQELASMLARRLGLQQRRLRTVVDARLKWVKYAVLALILVAVKAVPDFAEQAVKVEPFETAISFYFVRDWPYVAWAAACLAFGLFIYRGYCRYLCPLGAALACMGRLQRWSWLPRRKECGQPCQSCRHRCEYQAIANDGRIQYSECFQCLDCVSIYQDPQRCLPLIRAQKRPTVHVVEFMKTEGA